MTAMTRGIVKGNWTGGYGTYPEISQRPGIHVTAAGSNSAWTGFADLAEAKAFVETGVGDLLLRVVDLRPMGERYPTGQFLSITYENGWTRKACVIEAEDSSTLRVVVDGSQLARLRRDPGGLVLAGLSSEYCHAVQVDEIEPEEEFVPEIG